MPYSSLWIVKSDGSKVAWSDDHAVGTLLLSGVSPEVALTTVKTARGLMEEFKVAEIYSSDWVLLSEEIRRGNLGEAALKLSAWAPEPLSDIDLSLDSAELFDERLAIANLAARPRLAGAYGAVQAHNLTVAAELALADLPLGRLVGEYLSVVDDVLLYSAQTVAEEYLAVVSEIVEQASLPLEPGALERLQRQFAGLSNQSTAGLKTRIATVNGLMKDFALSGGSSRAMSQALQTLNGILFDVTPGTVPKEIIDDPYALTEELRGQTQARPRKHAADTTPASTYTGGAPPNLLGGTRLRAPGPNDDPRDLPPPLTYGEEIEDAYYFGWSTLEFKPLIRLNDRHDLFVFEPSRSEGDKPIVWETHHATESVLHTPDPLSRLNWVEKQWLPDSEQYWPPYPKRAFVVPTEWATRLSHFAIFANRKDLADKIDDSIIEDVIKQVRKQIDDKKLEEKIRAEAEKLLEDLLDGVTIFGFGVGKAGSTVAKLGASLAIDIISWLLDELTRSSDRWEILVTHSTLWVGAKPQSWVSWTIKDVRSGKSNGVDPYTPANTSTVGASQGARERLRLLLKQQFGEALGELSPTLMWRGECSVPNAPREMLRNVVQGVPADAVLWPKNPYQEGGHVFFRLKGKNATYAVALRSEVRANYWAAT